jgi:hypothetical protein
VTRTTRAERMTQPRAADAIRMLAEASGGCVRPVQLRRTNLDTGQTEQVIVPCGSTLESACPACAERCQSLRAQQCRDGWHLEDEPTAPPHRPDDWQTWLLEKRKWSGKTLADHRGDRKAWLLDMLGLPDPDDTGRYRWEKVTPADTDFMNHSRRMLHVLADRARWRAALSEARRRAQEADKLSATGRAA